MLETHQRMASLLKSPEAAVRTDELRAYIGKTLPVAGREQGLAQSVRIE